MIIPNVFLVKAHFDFLGLSTDDKPTKAKNGSTFLEVNTSDFYVFYEGTWYKQ